MKNKAKRALGDILRGVERMEIKGVSIDSRTIKKGELFVAIKGVRFDGHDFVSEALKRGAWGAVVERTSLESRYDSFSGLKNIIPVEDTLLSLQEMSSTHRKKFTIPFVGITGSNGKTTTKEMLACILRQKGQVLKNEGNLNNHIGVPLTLMKLGKHHRFAAIEMGMSGTGEIEMLTRLVLPDVGVITNIGPAHLEYLGSLDMVANAKGELLENMRPDGTAVLNADDRYFDVLRNRYRGRIISIGIDHPADVRAQDIGLDDDATDFTLRTTTGTVPVRLRAIGRHNVYNALAAAAAALAEGFTLERITDGLAEFTPFSMRSEIKKLHGRTVFEDCYNANPQSMAAALEMLVSVRLGRMTIAVLGDMMELGESAPEAHREVGHLVARLGVDLLITLGALARSIGTGALEAGMSKERVIEAASNAHAASLLQERTRSGDAILIKGSRTMKMEKILEEF